MSRCCINFTLQLIQLKHISEPSVFKASNNAEEIRLNNSVCFLYMQHIPDHHLSTWSLLSCLFKVLVASLKVSRTGIRF